jgi:hypothetical protein
MELGHNISHGQWDWMNDPEIHSNTWEWDTVGLTSQWHNYPTPRLLEHRRGRRRPRIPSYPGHSGPAVAAEHVVAAVGRGPAGDGLRVGRRTARLDFRAR